MNKADRGAEVNSQHETTNKLRGDEGLSSDWVFDMSEGWIHHCKGRHGHPEGRYIPTLKLSEDVITC